MRRNRQHEQPPAFDDPGFNSVGALLSQPEQWSAWLGERPKTIADLFASTIDIVARIAGRTEWPREVVLDQLGCNTKTQQQLDELTEVQLRRCAAYMEWIESLLVDLDLTTDYRLTVSGGARFFVTANLDLDSCRTAFESGDFSGHDYLRIGEIAEAFLCATRNLEGSAGEQARVTREGNPFLNANTPHISLARLELLAAPTRLESLGARTVFHMHEHIRNCNACRRALRRTKGEHATISSPVVHV